MTAWQAVRSLAVLAAAILVTLPTVFAVLAP